MSALPHKILLSLILALAVVGVSTTIALASSAPQSGRDAFSVNSGLPSTLTIAAACGGSYRVRVGDTLSKIANRCGVKKSALQAANGISSNRQLRVGMTLSIPRTNIIPRKSPKDVFTPPPDASTETPRSTPTPEPLYPAGD